MTESEVTTAEASSIREKQWGEFEGQTDAIRTELGETIDPLVRDLVTGLNVFGIVTTDSCEGHVVNRTIRAPYVAIGIAQDSEEITAEQLHAKNHGMQMQLNGHLKEFYAGRLVTADAQLVVEPEGLLAGGLSLLRNRGKLAFQNVGSDVEVGALRAFQTEMQDFGTFLKKRFIHPPISK